MSNIACKSNHGGFVIENNILKKYNGNEKRVVIPEIVKEIDKGAFAQNEVVEEVVFPADIHYIGNRAFGGCTGLKSISFRHISEPAYNGSGIFEDCKNLKRVDFTDWESLWNYQIDTGGEPFHYGAKLYIAGIEQSTIILFTPHIPPAHPLNLRALSGIEAIEKICFEDQSEVILLKQSGPAIVAKKDCVMTVIKKYPQIKDMDTFEDSFDEIKQHLFKCAEIVPVETEEELEYQLFCKYHIKKLDTQDRTQKRIDFFEAKYDKYKDSFEWEANVGRLKRVARYKQLTLLGEDSEITEEDIQDWAVKRVCVEFNVPVERFIAELLKQPYTGYEEYDA